jgi:hypothetical protein
MMLIGVTKNWIGLSTDTKPAVNVWAGDTFYETDTRSRYIYGETGWVVEKKMSDLSEGTPVNAVEAYGYLKVTGTPTADTTFIVDAQTFIFKAAAATTAEITIGASIATTALNMAVKINLALSSVNATASGATVTITAATAGTLGSSIVLTEACEALTVSAGGKLSGGIDGTVGYKQNMMYDDDYFYFCIDDNTVSGKNWRSCASRLI